MILKKMPRKVADKIPERFAFTFTPINRSHVQKAMDAKEFSGVSNLINTALTFYFENNGKTALTKEWMLSQEGEKFIKDLMRKAMEE